MKLLWLTSETAEKNLFDTSKISEMFKKVDLLSRDTSLLRKISSVHDFINTNIDEKMNKEEAYTPLDFVYLYNIEQAPCDIFLKISDKKYVKIINEGDSFEINDIVKKYEDKNIKDCYITFHNLTKFKGIVLKNVFKFDKAEPIPGHLHVTDAVLSIARDFGITDYAIEGINETFANINQEFNSNIKLKSLLENLGHLNGTAIGNHCYLTAIFLTIIGNKVPWFNREVKKNLFTAAFLHDLDIIGTGLEHYEFKTIHEINGLVPKDRDLIKYHTQSLAKKLEKMDVIPTDVITIILKHHEGGGSNSYPQGLQGSQLSPPSCLFNTAHQFSVELSKYAFNPEKIDQVITDVREHLKGNAFKNFIDILEAEIKL